MNEPGRMVLEMTGKAPDGDAGMAIVNAEMEWAKCRMQGLFEQGWKVLDPLSFTIQENGEYRIHALLTKRPDEGWKPILDRRK